MMRASCNSPRRRSASVSRSCAAGRSSLSPPSTQRSMWRRSTAHGVGHGRPGTPRGARTPTRSHRAPLRHQRPSAARRRPPSRPSTVRRSIQRDRAPRRSGSRDSASADERLPFVHAALAQVRLAEHQRQFRHSRSRRSTAAHATAPSTSPRSMQRASEFDAHVDRPGSSVPEAHEQVVHRVHVPALTRHRSPARATARASAPPPSPTPSRPAGPAGAASAARLS